MSFAKMENENWRQATSCFHSLTKETSFGNKN